MGCAGVALMAPSSVVRELCEALEVLMASEGGEPRKGDVESVAAWRRARRALVQARAWRDS